MQAGFPLNLELPESDEFFDDKADILEINGLATSQEFILTTEEEPSGDLLAYLRLINLSGLSHVDNIPLPGPCKAFGYQRPLTNTRWRFEIQFADTCADGSITTHV